MSLYLVQFFIRLLSQSSSLLSPFSEALSSLGQLSYFPGAFLGLILFELSAKKNSSLRLKLLLGLLFLAISLSILILGQDKWQFALSRFLQGLSMGLSRLAITMLAEGAAEKIQIIKKQFVLNRINAISAPLVVTLAGLLPGLGVLTLGGVVLIIGLFLIKKIEEKPCLSESKFSVIFHPSLTISALVYLLWMSSFWGVVAHSCTVVQAGQIFLIEASTYAFLGPKLFKIYQDQKFPLQSIAPLIATALLCYTLFQADLFFWHGLSAFFLGLSHCHVYPHLQKKIDRSSPQKTRQGQRSLILGSDCGQALGLAISAFLGAHSLMSFLIFLFAAFWLSLSSGGLKLGKLNHDANEPYAKGH